MAPSTRHGGKGRGPRLPPAASSPPPAAALDVAALEAEALVRIAAAKSPAELLQVKAHVLGKAGALGQATRSLGQLAAAARPAAGVAVNALKKRLEAALRAAYAEAQARAREAVAAAARTDVSLPGRRTLRGHPHPLRLVEAEVLACLTTLGFETVDGRQVEHDWFNFAALNIGPDHPARDMQDTFFLAPDVVLRTHTSNVQIRTLLQRPPPLRVVSAGMVFRHDDVDATHAPAFHQLEGLWVDERVTFTDLKGVLTRLMQALFGADAEVRFRPSFFPFTEPSLELDVGCVACGRGSGLHACGLCRGTGWLEILGAGMVDPAVLTAVNLDPDRFQGFAFGLGLERIALLRWAIDDIRHFYDNNLAFLRQFSAPGRQA